MLTKNSLTLRNANARGIWISVCALVLTACHGGLREASVATPQPGVPAQRQPVPPVVQAARHAIRAHDRGEALRLLGAERGLDPREPERSWLLAALWLDLGARDGALARAERMPPCPLRRALRSLLTVQPREALHVLQPGGGALPSEPFTDLALALAFAGVEDPGRARIHATKAWRGTSDFVRVEASLVLASLAMEEGNIEAAAQVLARTFADAGGYDARLPRMEAQIERRAGNLARAADRLLASLRVAPRNEHVARDLADLWREGLDPPVQRSIAEALAAMDAAIATNPEAQIVVGMTLAEERPEAAVARYETALARRAVAVPAERELRLLYFRLGRHADGLRLLAKALPPGVASRPGNLVGDRWRTLWAVGRQCPHPTTGTTHALGAALLGVGALEDAQAVLRASGDPRSEPLGRRIASHLAFEKGLRRLIERGYQVAAAQDEPPGCASVLARLPQLAAQTLPPDEARAFRDPTIGVHTMPFVGTWLDHRARTSSPVVQHFRRYGRYLMFGQRTDAPVEVVVFSMASLEERRVIRTAGRNYRHDVAIGYDRGLRSHVDAQGGSLGGACLADSIWIDADSARYSEHALRRSLVRDPAILAFTRRSQPPRGAPFDLDDPGTVAIRLFARYVARRPNDEWGSYHTLCAHEFGHVVDLREYLPLEENLGKAIGLLAGAGFSANRVERELERRAQLAACVDARDADLALAEMCLALPVTSTEPEVHDGGYHDGLRDMVRHWHRHPGRYGRFDETRSLVGQLDRLREEDIRRLAYNALVQRR